MRPLPDETALALASPIELDSYEDTTPLDFFAYARARRSDWIANALAIGCLIGIPIGAALMAVAGSFA